MKQHAHLECENQTKEFLNVLFGQCRQGFLNKFLREIDALAPSLPEAERQRRANALLRAHMVRLAVRSAQARRGERAR